MDVIQQFIGEKCSIGEWFRETVSEYPGEVSSEIYRKISTGFIVIPKVNDFTQYIGVMSHVDRDTQFFFELEVLNESGFKPIFLEIYEVDQDYYLEMYRNQNTIEYFIK